MPTILVGPEQLRAKAEQLRLSAATLSRLLKNVDQAVRGLNPALFEGQRADQVRRRYESQRQQILAAPELLLGYARALDSAATMFEQADMKPGSSNSSTGDLIPDVLTLINNLSKYIVSGRMNLWEEVKRWGGDRNFYNQIKWIAPKHSTRLGMDLKRVAKSLPFIQLVTGTAIDFAESPEKNFHTFMIALDKNLIETAIDLICPVMFYNSVVQVFGDLATIGFDLTIPIITDDPAMQADLRAINTQLEQALDKIDLEHFTHDIGAIYYRISPIGSIAHTTENAYNYFVNGSDTSRTFWNEPNIQNGVAFYNDFASNTYSPYYNLIGEDARAIGQDLGNFADGITAMPVVLLKTFAGITLVYKTSEVEAMLLPDNLSAGLTSLSRDMLHEIAQFPTPADFLMNAQQVYTPGLQMGDLTGLYNASVDLWQPYPQPDFGFSHVLINDLQPTS